MSFTAPQSLIAGDGVSLDRLQPASGAAVKTMRDDLDGDLARFGKKAAAVLRQLLVDVGAPTDQPIVTLKYNDRYLNSPLVVRLALETFKELAQNRPGEPVAVELNLKPLETSDRPARWLWNDWKRANDRLDVIGLYGRRMGLSVTSREGATRHGRVLELTYANGVQATILFDQGFGAWEGEGASAPFDFHAIPMQQANALGSAHLRLKGRVGGTYFVAHLGRV